MPHIRPTSLSQSLRCTQRVVVPVCDRVSGFLFVRDVKNTHIVSCVGDERMQHSSFVHKGNKHVMLSGLGFSSIPSGHWYFSHVAVPEIHPHTPGQTDRQKERHRRTKDGSNDNTKRVAKLPQMKRLHKYLARRCRVDNRAQKEKNHTKTWQHRTLQHPAIESRSPHICERGCIQH